MLPKKIFTAVSLIDILQLLFYFFFLSAVKKNVNQADILHLLFNSLQFRLQAFFPLKASCKKCQFMAILRMPSGVLFIWSSLTGIEVMSSKLLKL